ncbi:MAG: DNA polymerase Y family protein [Pseudomonadota bacterium]
MTKGNSKRPRRILAAWFPHWSTDHLKRRQPALKNSATPIVFYETVQSALRIRTLDETAAQAGFHRGQPLADARAIEPTLIAIKADPEREKDAFARLCEGLMRYSPIVSIEQTSTAFIDITGCERLFGGEAAILSDLQKRMRRLGYGLRASIADSAGAAWGLARFGDGGITPQGDNRAAIAPLPVEALRLPEALSDRLRRLGLKKVDQLYDMPRTPLTARFSHLLLKRLGQALGQEPEPLNPIVPAPQFYAEQKLAEPIASMEAIMACLEPLAEALTAQLEQAAVGGRRFELALFRVDNHVTRMTVRASSPARDGTHLKRLFANKLDDFKSDYDAGFGFELLRLSAFDSAPIAIRQHGALTTASDSLAQDDAFDALKDRLSNRLGQENVCRVTFRNTHLPERAAGFASVITALRKEEETRASDIRDHARPRPVKLLPHPEPIEAIAEVPDGPPLQFSWRRVRYQVAKANGPERIADEWAHKQAPNTTRDYYRIETYDGRRYWLFRDGLFERETDQPKWFLHGFFP